VTFVDTNVSHVREFHVWLMTVFEYCGKVVYKIVGTVCVGIRSFPRDFSATKTLQCFSKFRGRSRFFRIGARIRGLLLTRFFLSPTVNRSSCSSMA